MNTDTWYQCSGSMTWFGSVSGSADPCLWLMDPDPQLFYSTYLLLTRNVNLQLVNQVGFWIQILIWIQQDVFLIFKNKITVNCQPLDPIADPYSENGSGSGSRNSVEIGSLRIWIRNPVYSTYSLLVCRLVNQANRGDYEQHLRAVKELSKLAVSDSEFCQLAQVLGFNTCA